MLRTMLLLTRPQRLDLFGWNAYRHAKDPRAKKRWRLMAGVQIFALLVLAGYLVALGVGLTMLGMAAVLPAYLFVVAALLILFFDLFKAGPLLYDPVAYEFWAPLPVSKTAVALSRFLGLYATDLACGLFVLLPGLAVYAAVQRPGAGFVPACLLGAILLPVLPLALAATLGAAVSALAARARHKSMAATVLMLGFVLLLLAGSTLLGVGAEGLALADWQNLAGFIAAQITLLYPPAAWFGQWVLHGDAMALLRLAAASLLPGAFILLIAVRYYPQLCRAMQPVRGAQRAAAPQKAASPLRALLTKELRRYFASSVYVTNTLIGPILTAALGIGLLAVGVDRVAAALNLPMFDTRLIPLLLAAPAMVGPTTAAAISMEGAQWWQTRTLPIRTRDLFAAKILLNLIVALPCGAVGVLCATLALRPTLPELAWLVLVPAAYLLYSTVAGLRLNLAFPMLVWENETRPIKQGAAAMLTMLAGLLALLPCGAALLVCPGNLVFAVALPALLAVTAVLYRQCLRVDLQKLG